MNNFEENLTKILESGTRQELNEFCKEHNLKIEDGVIKAVDPKQAKAKFTYWDKRQLIKKICLNALYGANLNPGSRFFDHRLGQSTTLTGRTIARHMAAEINKIITGEYDYKGDGIIYGDTDASYFSAYPMFKDKIDSGEFKWDKDIAVELYDEISNQTNDSFSDYMKRAHNCPQKFGNIIKAARETVSERGLFISKKRYGLLVYDKEGVRYDKDESKGDLKVMGLEIKRSDTPVYMQEFLTNTLRNVLEGATEDDIIESIIEFRQEFRDMPPWLQGSPKRCNNLTKYTEQWKKTGKCGVGHIMAAINYNRLREMHKDNHSLEIVDGMKTIVCKLKTNPLKMSSIAIPTDEKRIPLWFQELPFDIEAMEDTIVTKKISNLLGVLDWDLSKTQSKTVFNDLFNF